MAHDVQSLIEELLAENPESGNSYVERNFPTQLQQAMVDPQMQESEEPRGLLRLTSGEFTTPVYGARPMGGSTIAQDKDLMKRLEGDTEPVDPAIIESGEESDDEGFNPPGGSRGSVITQVYPDVQKDYEHVLGRAGTQFTGAPIVDDFIYGVMRTLGQVK